MSTRSRIFKLVVSSCSIVSGGIIVNSLIDKKTLKALDAKPFEPSVKWDHNWDKRDPSSLIKPKSKHLKNVSTTDLEKQKSNDDFELNKASSKANRHLFLIRHGNYEINEKEHEKRVLTQLGREQAKSTANYLKELAAGKKFKYTKLYYSTMIRAIQTAEIIKEQLPTDIPVIVDPLLCEGAPISTEPPTGHWIPELHYFQDGARIEAAFRKYFHRAESEQLEDSYEIIVCHANVIRYFFCRALQFPADAWLRFELGHGSVTHIIIRPDGRVLCRTLGETGFQPKSILS